MKILVTHFLPHIVSGAEYAISDMLGQVSREFLFTMLVPGEGRLAAYYRSNGFKVWTKTLHTRRRRYPGLHLLQSMEMALKLKGNFDVVLCNTFAATSRIWTACRLAHVPYGIYVREYFSNKSIHRQWLKYSSQIFAVSKDVKVHIDSILMTDKISVTYDYIDIPSIVSRSTKHRQSGTRKSPYSASHPIVGFVGRLTEYKRPDIFIQCIPHILSKMPNARFVVVGGDPVHGAPYESRLRQLIRKLDIGDYISLMGLRSDSIEILSELSCLCLPSTREPFPRTVLEAQAIGVPVVVSASGGCLEMVQDEIDGLTFSIEEPRVVRECARQIVRVLTNPNFHNQLVQNAQNSIAQGAGSHRPVEVFEANLRKTLIVDEEA